MLCNHTIYLITDKEDAITKLTLAKLLYDENNRGRMRGKIFLTSSISKAIEHALTFGGWNFFITPGQIFLKDFWKEFDLIKETAAAFAHIMTDASIHYQCAAINFDKLSQTEYHINTEGTGPRGYPSRLAKGTIEPISPLQKLLSRCLDNNVLNWPEELRIHKLHFYRKHWAGVEQYLIDQTFRDIEWNQQHYDVLDSCVNVCNRHKDLIWVVNNKRPLPFKAETLICPAAGTFWLEVDAKEIIVADNNPTQLAWAKAVWHHQPKDIISFTEAWVKDKPNVKPNYHNKIVGNINYNRKVEFINLDFYSDEILNITDKTIWVSNIYTYEPNILKYGFVGIEILKLLKLNNIVIEDYEIKHGWI